jgi:hypothetical protein
MKTKPLSDDTLNLWRGKRLNRVEMKVEQRLHVRIGLWGRVYLYEYGMTCRFQVVTDNF